jgi:hypothetical protein
MSPPAVLQQVVHTRFVALGVVDGLARALRTAGEVPPPLGEIACDIVGRTADPGRPFDPPRRLWTFRNASGFLILDGTYTVGRGGHRQMLGEGTYLVRARGAYYQDTAFTLRWPPPDGVTRLLPIMDENPVNVELRPGAAYPLPDVTTARFQLGPTILRGSLYKASGEPLPAVTVELREPQVEQPPFLAPQGLPLVTRSQWPFLKATSDSRGNWILVLPDRRYLDNTPELLPGEDPPEITRPMILRCGPPVNLDLPVNVALGRDMSVRNTGLRGQVVGPGGRPIPGAEIASSIGPERSRSRADGVWFLYFPLNRFSPPNPPSELNVTVTVTTPEGASANSTVPLVTGGATVVVPTFHIS